MPDALACIHGNNGGTLRRDDHDDLRCYTNMSIKFCLRCSWTARLLQADDLLALEEPLDTIAQHSVGRVVGRQARNINELRKELGDTILVQFRGSWYAHGCIHFECLAWTNTRSMLRRLQGALSTRLAQALAAGMAAECPNVYAMCDRVDVSLADDPHVQVLSIQHSKHENDDLVHGLNDELVDELVDGLINDLNDELIDKLDDQDDQYIIENSSSAAGTDEECWQDRIVDTDLESLIDIDLTAIDDSDVDSVAGHIACHSARDNNNNDDNGPGDDNVTASTTNPTNNATNNVTYNGNATNNATNNPNRHATVEKKHDPLEDTRRSEYADQISKEVKACADRYAYRTACSLEDLIGLLPSNEELWS